MASRGISPIQKQARGKKMAKEDMRKSMAPKPSKSSVKIKAKRPALDSMSVGAAMAPQPPSTGLRSALPGMKKGGSCGTKMAKGGACKGYFKGGSVDGAISKGHTKGKIC